MIFEKFKKTKLVCAMSLVTFLSACGTTKQLTNEELNARVTKTQQNFFKDQPDFKANQKITLGESMARALLYNLDERIKQMEIAVESGQLDIERVNLLPELMVKAGYSRRNNDSASFSRNLATGTTGDSYNSSNKDVKAANMDFSWDILDLAVGIARVEIQKNKIQVTKIKKQQAIERIIRDVRYSYWRAIASKEVVKGIVGLNSKIDHQLFKIDKSLKYVGSQEALQLLKNKRSLLRTQKEVAELDRNANNTIQELNTLINIKPGIPFKVVKPKSTSLHSVNVNEVSAEKLERFMFEHSHDLHLTDYNVLITSKEAKKDLLALMPSLKPTLSAHYSNNSFLVNSTYQTWAINFAFDLFKLVKYPSVKRLGKSKILTSNSNRLAVMMNMLASLHVSIDKYNNLLSSYKFAYKLSNTHRKLALSKKREASVGIAASVDLISAQMKALKSHYSSALMFADLQDAKSNLYKTLGLFPMNKSVSSHNLSELGAELTTRDAKMQDPKAVLKRIIANQKL